MINVDKMLGSYLDTLEMFERMTRERSKWYSVYSMLLFLLAMGGVVVMFELKWLVIGDFVVGFWLGLVMFAAGYIGTIYYMERAYENSVLNSLCNLALDIVKKTNDIDIAKWLVNLIHYKIYGVRPYEEDSGHENMQ